MLLVDDTILIRGDAPDVFDVVPKASIGATVEDARVRRPIDTDALGRIALLLELRYPPDEPLLSPSDSLDVNVANGHFTPPKCNLRIGEGPADDRRYFNSGFVVLSEKHACMVADLPPGPLNYLVKRDQGLLNARRRLALSPLHDLGLYFNWIGSFNETNQHQRPCDAIDAWVVHATTGKESRLQFFKKN